MSPELKAFIQLIFDAILVGEDIIDKKSFLGTTLPDVFKTFPVFPQILLNYNDLHNEIISLKDPLTDADLLEFISSQLPKVLSDDHIVSITLAALKVAEDMIIDVSELVKAIKGDDL